MKRFKSVVMAALAVIVTVATYAPTASADSASLSITPKKNYVIEPGKSVNDKLTIRNLDVSDGLNLTLRVVDFTYTDDSGTPKLFLDPEAPQTTWSLKPFLTLPKNVSVEPGKSVTLDMKVDIPAGHGAGSYYSAIVYSSTSGEGGNIGLSASGVTLMFANVPGKVKEDLQLQKFGAYNDSTKKYSFITTTKPQNVAYTVKNNGNVTEAPVGQIRLKHMFIGKEISIDNINPSGSLALIGQIRTFVSCIELKEAEVKLNGEKSRSTECTEPTLWPGRYTATIDLFYGQNGNPTNEIVKTIHFWYLPLWFIIIVLVLVSVISFYIWRFVRKVKGKSGRINRRK